MINLPKLANSIVEELQNPNILVKDFYYPPEVMEIFNQGDFPTGSPDDWERPGIHYYINGSEFNKYIGLLIKRKIELIQQISQSVKYLDNDSEVLDLIIRLFTELEVVSDYFRPKEENIEDGYSHPNVKIDFDLSHYEYNENILAEKMSELFFNLKIFIDDSIKEFEGIVTDLQNMQSNNNIFEDILAFKLKKQYSDRVTIKSLWYSLRDNDFIAKSVPENQFRKIFLGGKVISKVQWSGNNSELKYLIKQLIKQQKLDRPSHNKWQVAAYCFSDENGDKIEPKTISWAEEPPAKAILIEQIVERIYD